MRLALTIGALACSTALGDETISTYGHMHSYAAGWEMVGQTFVVPPSNMLDTVTFTLKGNGNADAAFLVSLRSWDAEEQVWHDETSIGSGSIGPGVIKTFNVDVDRLLPVGADVVLVLTFPNEVEPIPGVAAVFDAYPDGMMVTSQFNDDIVVWPSYDMLFSVEFMTCLADFNGDGALDILDYLTFDGEFSSGSMTADCNNDGALDVLDFVCFQEAFLGGCGQ